MITFFNGII